MSLVLHRVDIIINNNYILTAWIFSTRKKAQQRRNGCCHGVRKGQLMFYLLKMFPAVFSKYIIIVIYLASKSKSVSDDICQFQNSKKSEIEKYTASCIFNRSLSCRFSALRKLKNLKTYILSGLPPPPAFFSFPLSCKLNCLIFPPKCSYLLMSINIFHFKRDQKSSKG